jgi:hypothetical protein
MELVIVKNIIDISLSMQIGTIEIIENTGFVEWIKSVSMTINDDCDYHHGI